MESWRSIVVSISIAFIMVTMVIGAGEDKEKNKEECKGELLSMANCLPYMKGTAKSPTPVCCSGLKEILTSDKNCICVIIQNRNDPALGLQNNVSLSYALPSLCQIKAADVAIAKCTAVLHLDPTSPEAQVIDQIVKAVNQTAPVSDPPSSYKNNGPRTAHKNNGPRTAHFFLKGWLGLEVVAHFFVILYIFILV